jgi:hypothetical protein
MSRNGDKQAYPVLGAAEWISLAAAPTFAIMAVLTGTLGGGPPDTFCSAAHRASPLSGMVLMYLLMSAFHSASWLKLISRRRSGARRSSRADGIFPPLSAEWIVTMAVENRPIDVDSCRDQADSESLKFLTSPN